MLDTYRLPQPFADVTVTFGPLSFDPASLTAVNDQTWADDETVVFITDWLTVAVIGLTRVEVDVRPGVHGDVVESMLYGYVMRALFRHAGMFSLHASLVQFGDGPASRAVAIAGHSGAGKSTTVSYTASIHPARVRVDDVLPVTVVAGQAMAHPFARPVHLIADAAARLGLDASAVSDDPAEGIGKVVVDLASPSGPVVVDHLVVLSVGDPDMAERLVIRSIRGAERLRHVVRNSNVTGIASFGLRADTYLRWATGVASCVPMTEVIRRPGDDTLDDVVDHIATGLVPAS
jgi:hypothetical protein